MIGVLLLLVGGAALALAVSGSDDSTDERSPDYSAMRHAVREKQLEAIRALPTMAARLSALLDAFPDANPAHADAYSSTIIQGDHGDCGNPGALPGSYGYNANYSKCVAESFPRDEFGRFYKGGPWKPGSFALDVFEQVLPYLPLPPGTKAAISVAIALGRGKALDDAALAAVRAELPPQAQLGFDLAVGIANGKSVEQAGKDALFERYPEAKQGYELAKGYL